jgi:hypothetical protein
MHIFCCAVVHRLGVCILAGAPVRQGLHLYVINSRKQNAAKPLTMSTYNRVKAVDSRTVLVLARMFATVLCSMVFTARGSCIERIGLVVFNDNSAGILKKFDFGFHPTWFVFCKSRICRSI